MHSGLPATPNAERAKRIGEKGKKRGGGGKEKKGQPCSTDRRPRWPDVTEKGTARTQHEETDTAQLRHRRSTGTARTQHGHSTGKRTQHRCGTDTARTQHRCGTDTARTQHRCVTGTAQVASSSDRQCNCNQHPRAIRFKGQGQRQRDSRSVCAHVHEGGGAHRFDTSPVPPVGCVFQKDDPQLRKVSHMPWGESYAIG